MSSEEFLGQVLAQCPTCGTSKVKYEDAIDELAGPFECVNCGRKFSKEELLADNLENLQLHAVDLARPLVEQHLRKWKKDLARSLNGNRNIRIK